MIIKIPYFRNRWKKSSTEEVNVEVEEDDEKTADMKVRAAVIILMLKQMGLGKGKNDNTKISRMIAFLTDNGYGYVKNVVQKGIILTDTHKEHIANANKHLSNLNSSITIEIDKEY